MKTLILCLAMFFATAALADDLTFAWDPNPEADVIGYRLKFGSESGVYTRSVNVGNVTTFTEAIDWSVENKEGTERYVVVTAYNAAGLESPPSNELDLGGQAPSAPQNPRVTLD
jgi:hypothetical protein